MSSKPVAVTTPPSLAFMLLLEEGNACGYVSAAGVGREREVSDWRGNGWREGHIAAPDRVALTGAPVKAFLSRRTLAHIQLASLSK